MLPNQLLAIDLDLDKTESDQAVLNALYDVRDFMAYMFELKRLCYRITPQFYKCPIISIVCALPQAVTSKVSFINIRRGAGLFAFPKSYVFKPIYESDKKFLEMVASAMVVGDLVDEIIPGSALNHNPG